MKVNNMILFLFSERRQYDSFHAFASIRCHELMIWLFTCLLIWKRAGEFEFEVEFGLNLI